MRLPKAGVTVDEERVVGLGRHLGDGQRGGVCQPVAVADDELLERVFRVEVVARKASLEDLLGLVGLAPVIVHELDVGTGPERALGRGPELRVVALADPGAYVARAP